MSTIHLRQLEVFHAIIETGSVTAAAAALHVTQPAISAVLKQFEERIQFKLFERRGGRLQPTPEAMELIPDVLEIFGRVRTLDRATDAMRDGLAGRVVVASSPTLMDSLLPRAVALFHAANPGVTVTLRSLSASMAVEGVSRREIDIGIVYSPEDDPAVEAEDLLRSQVACVLPPRHPLAAKRTISATDLVGQTVISIERVSKIGKLGREIALRCEAAGVPPPEPVIEPSSSLTACMLVREGIGIGLVDRVAVMSGAFSDLVLRPFHPRVPLRVQMIFPRDRIRSRPTLELASALRRIAAERQRVKSGSGT